MFSSVTIVKTKTRSWRSDADCPTAASSRGLTSGRYRPVGPGLWRFKRRFPPFRRRLYLSDTTDLVRGTNKRYRA